ncbi:hypothetical protein B0H14DRAFT_2575555 [Mycena olivaceomarginata]|nr:hypothetical protein B0H14DRAFT_2575555 [Mycena olivaceomarginata]
MSRDKGCGSVELTFCSGSSDQETAAESEGNSLSEGARRMCNRQRAAQTHALRYAISEQRREGSGLTACTAVHARSAPGGDTYHKNSLSEGARHKSDQRPERSGIGAGTLAVEATHFLKARLAHRLKGPSVGGGEPARWQYYITGMQTGSSPPPWGAMATLEGARELTKEKYLPNNRGLRDPSRMVKEEEAGKTPLGFKVAEAKKKRGEDQRARLQALKRKKSEYVEDEVMMMAKTEEMLHRRR